MPTTKKLPKIRDRLDLGDLAGEADRIENLISLDRSLSPSERLEIIVHEALHLADWKMEERKVRRIAAYIAAVLWKDGYRKVR